MNELKYQIVQFIFIMLLGAGAYWAFSSMDDGIRYERDRLVEIDPLPTEIEPPLHIPEEPENSEEINVVVPHTTETNSETTTTESVPDGLESELQSLIDENITLTQGAKGDRVKTIQTFLKWYFDDRNVSVDSDYGPATVRLVREFQSTELNGGDGRTGPNTMRKMVELLK